MSFDLFIDQARQRKRAENPTNQGHRRKELTRLLLYASVKQHLEEVAKILIPGRILQLIHLEKLDDLAQDAKVAVKRQRVVYIDEGEVADRFVMSWIDVYPKILGHSSCV